ncbi:hypothetical protein X777_01120 [Ooceraea biroi]|uniref:Uncharacterized protein n=1 Tax=Ooceraea biroi TaxID=2015173 RepID=A0A026VTJ1_OOCBI|nr:hypothetical protein X777_01120 [Ooceraea biroi]
MLTKKDERWYADWIVAADVYTDLPGSPRESKDEVLQRLDELLRQQGDELENTGMHAAHSRRHFTARKKGACRTRYKKASCTRRTIRTSLHVGVSEGLLAAVTGGWARDGRPAGGGERANPYQALPRGLSTTVSLVENIRRLPRGARVVVVVTETLSYFQRNVRVTSVHSRSSMSLDIPNIPRHPSEIGARTRCTRELAAAAPNRV